MTTSPAPISAADREKAREQIAFAVCSREECICEPGEFQQRCLGLGDDLREAIAGQLGARVVELEAALESKKWDVDYVAGEWQIALNESEARATALLEALRTAIKVADEAREEWDKAPSGMKAGKLLIALSDPSLKYRADITAMHAAINAGASNERS